MNFEFEFDGGMKATMKLNPDTAEARKEEIVVDGDGEEGRYYAGDSVSFFPSSGGDGSAACSAPPEKSWFDYPIRLVKSGRYLHHWYAEKVGCADVDDTRIEIKVTPDW